MIRTVRTDSRATSRRAQLIRAGGNASTSVAAAATPHAEPRDEAADSINSEGPPQAKGVLYHQRGDYLQALAMVAHMRLDCTKHLLWTCRCFRQRCASVGVTAAGATHCACEARSGIIWRHMRSRAVRTSAPADGADHDCLGGCGNTGSRARSAGRQRRRDAHARYPDAHSGMYDVRTCTAYRTFGRGRLRVRAEWGKLPSKNRAISRRARRGHVIARKSHVDEEGMTCG